MNSPEEFYEKEVKEIKEIATNPVKVTAELYLDFYQRYISPINQEGCPMFPSCSEYSKQSIRKYKLKGFLMTFDRLHRCGHDKHTYRTIYSNGKVYYFDPVE